MAKEIKLMIVDDSKVSRDLLAYIVESDPLLKVIALAEDGEQALELLIKESPDVVITDIVMPKMDGFKLTRKIMETKPTPIIVVSGIFNREEVKKSFQAIAAGALAIIEKPKGFGDSQYIDTARFVIETIKALSEIKLESGRNFSLLKPFPLAEGKAKDVKSPYLPPTKKTSEEGSKALRAVGIGASIGGPQALCSILAGLPPDFPAPIFIVQHISSGFVDGLVNWLSESTSLKVKIAENGEVAQPGFVYVAPDKFHLEIGEGGLIKLTNPTNPAELPPSIGYLFRSITRVYGSECAGILLTGVGRDGAADLLAMKEKGALTLVQDEDSSVKFDMPREAIKIGAAQKILPLKEIPHVLLSYAFPTPTSSPAKK